MRVTVFALCLKFFEMEGRFPDSAEEIPVEVVDFVARQVGVRFDVFGGYDWSGRSWKRHRAEIRARYGSGPGRHVAARCFSPLW